MQLKYKYKDKMRWLWILSVIFPTISIPGIFLHHQTGNGIFLFYPFVVTYLITPFLDLIVGEYNENHPREFKEELGQKFFYKLLTFIVVPIHVVVFFISAFYVGTKTLVWWELILISVAAGLASGLAINTGHELGHKKTKFERNLAKIVLAIPAYGHFTIEHNRGHHSNVSTPEDAASAMMGENIYEFALREMPKSFLNAIEIETTRLHRTGKSFWSRENQMLHSFVLTFLIQISLLILFGIKMIPFLLIHNFFAWWQLTSANYIEHYGLLREQKSDGRYEPCKPHHSWNSNYLLGNLHLFNLQRHSDHHTHPSKRYHMLDSYEDLPSLPSGYLGCYLLAYIPWLWFHVMNKKLIALKHINHDFSKINIHPEKKDMLVEKYSL